MKEIKEVGKEIYENVCYFANFTKNLCINCFNACKNFYIKYEAEINLAVGIAMSVFPVLNKFKFIKKAKDGIDSIAQAAKMKDGIMLLPIIKPYSPPIYTPIPI